MIFKLQAQPRLDCIREGKGHNECLVSLANSENISLKKFIFNSNVLNCKANHPNRRYLGKMWLLDTCKEIEFGKK